MTAVSEKLPRVVDAVRALDLAPFPPIEHQSRQHAIVGMEIQYLVEVRPHQLVLEALRLFRRQPRMTAIGENGSTVLDAVHVLELIPGWQFPARPSRRTGLDSGRVAEQFTQPGTYGHRRTCPAIGSVLRLIVRHVEGKGKSNGHRAREAWTIAEMTGAKLLHAEIFVGHAEPRRASGELFVPNPENLPPFPSVVRILDHVRLSPCICEILKISEANINTQPFTIVR
jgi:hypothetical protein